MNDLLVVVPSRERPENIARLIEAMEETCRADTKLLVGLDDDDPTLDSYKAIPGLWAQTEPDLRQVVGWINRLAVPLADAFRFIGHFGDDNVPRTVGWDQKVIESLERQGAPSFCFADDLYPGRVTGTLCCHIFMSAEVVRSLGYIGPPAFRHMYVDPVWMAWGEALGIEFLSDVVLEHMHYSCGKSSMDPSYQASLDATAADLDTFNAYVRSPNGLNADIERIKAGARAFSPEEIEQFKRELNIPERW